MTAFLISERDGDLQLFYFISFRRGEKLLMGWGGGRGPKYKCQTKQEQIPESCIATHIFTPADTIWVGVYKNQHNSLMLPPKLHTRV